MCGRAGARRGEDHYSPGRLTGHQVGVMLRAVAGPVDYRCIAFDSAICQIGSAM